MQSLLNPDFKYVPANSTNIAETFKKYGFIAPSTLRQFQPVQHDLTNPYQTSEK
jgi:hypothetical protein